MTHDEPTAKPEPSDDTLEETSGIPGAIHHGNAEIEEEVAESQIGVGGEGRGDAGGPAGE